MNITLIAPPWYWRYGEEIPYLPQNLGLGYLASFLEKNGHTAVIIDTLAEGLDSHEVVDTKYQRLKRVGLSYGEILKRIPQDSNIIGITCPFTFNAPIVKELSKEIKTKYPEIPIVVGGMYPSTLPEKALSEHVDYVIRGEGEIPMKALASNVPVNQIKGVVFRDNNKIVNNEIADKIKNLDEIPFPSRHLLPMEKYFEYSPRGAKKKRTIVIITSRGCPFNCGFCSVHLVCGRQWRSRTPKNVLDEIEYVIEKYNIEHIEFEDDNMMINRKRAEMIVDGIKNLNKDITWSTPSGVRADTLDRKLLEKIKTSGCTSLSFGIESGDPVMLKKMNKRLDLKKVTEVVRICKELDIHTQGFFIVGYPGETKESFQKTIKFAKRLSSSGMNTFNFFVAKAYPGTELFSYSLENGLLITEDIDDTWILLSYTNMKNKDFSPEEALWRRDYAIRKLNPLRKRAIQNLKRLIRKEISLRRITTRAYQIYFRKFTT